MNSVNSNSAISTYPKQKKHQANYTKEHDNQIAENQCQRGSR